MKVALMAELSRLGNDEPRNWLDRPIKIAAGALQTAGKKMINSARTLADFTTSHRVAAFAVAFVLAVTVFGFIPVANARVVRSAHTYDGTWNVVFFTRAGNCSSTNSAPFTVSGRRLYSAGGGKVTGGISPTGIVAVRISVGRSAASGNGRLVGNSGSGRWSGIITGDRCSGTWQATRG
jgi:hypothetical protein